MNKKIIILIFVLLISIVTLHYHEENTSLNEVKKKGVKSKAELEKIYSKSISSLPSFNIRMSLKDFTELSKNAIEALKPRINFKTDRVRRKIIIENQDNKFKGKISLRGATPGNFEYKKKSYSVKLSDNKYWNGFKELNFITPLQQSYLNPFLVNTMASELDLVYVKKEPVLLKFNNLSKGVYILEEPLNNDFLELHGISNSVLIQLKDGWVENHGNNPAGLSWGHYTGTDWEFSNLKKIKHPLEKTINYKYSLIGKHLEANNTKSLLELFNIDYIARFEALRNILGINHDVAGDNLNMYYSLTDGKFYPIIRSEGDIHPIEIKNGTSMQSFNKLYKDFDPTIENLYKAFHDSSKFRLLKLKYINNIINNFPEIEKKLVFQYNSLSPSFILDPHDHHNIQYKSRLSRMSLQVIKKNISTLRQQISSFFLFANLMTQPKELIIEVIPDGVTNAKFSNFTIELQKKSSITNILCSINGKENDLNTQMKIKETKRLNVSDIFNQFNLIPSFNEDFSLVRTKFICKFKMDKTPHIEGYTIEMKNILTDKQVEPKNINVSIASSNLVKKPKLDAIKLLLAKGAKKKSKEITLPKKDYHISSNLIIPKGYKIQIEDGAKILLAPRVSVLSYSPINFHGKTEGITITSDTPSSHFGSFAIIGNKSMNMVIEGLRVSKGSEAIINGINFTGAFAIHEANLVKIKNSRFFKNIGDDGLNIKYSHVNISNSKFDSNISDQVDLDFCRGDISNSTFHGGSTHSNGDGLDLSGSILTILNSKFINNTDKGLSIGEKTKLIAQKNNFSGNNMGVAIKDSSKVILLNNHLNSNNLAVSAYVKKSKFSGAKVYHYNNEMVKNKIKFKSDKLSKINKLNFKYYFNCTFKGKNLAHKNFDNMLSRLLSSSLPSNCR